MDPFSYAIQVALEDCIISFPAQLKSELGKLEQDGRPRTIILQTFQPVLIG